MRAGEGAAEHQVEETVATAASNEAKDGGMQELEHVVGEGGGGGSSGGGNHSV